MDHHRLRSDRSHALDVPVAARPAWRARPGDNRAARDRRGQKKKKKVKLCLNGMTIMVPKKKQGGYLSQGATVGACSGACLPQCSPEKTCGPDGCGGTCGNCPGDKTCQGGTCACPPEDFDCGDGVCFPNPIQCCSTDQCQPGQQCVRGQCLTWQGTCSPAADSCSSPVGCDANDNCGCYQSTEGETRCGSAAGMDPPCEVCESSADCAAQFPAIPGVFCVQKGNGNFCCPGACVRPCPRS